MSSKIGLLDHLNIQSKTKIQFVFVPLRGTDWEQSSLRCGVSVSNVNFRTSLKSLLGALLLENTDHRILCECLYKESCMRLRKWVVDI